MKTFTITKAMADLIREGAVATKNATAIKKKAAESLAAKGARGFWFSKEGVTAGLITQDTFDKMQTLIASGLLDKDQFSLWAMGPDLAKEKGLNDERNRLTSSVSAYLSSFRNMIETAWRKANPETAEKETAEKETAEKETAEKETAEKETAEKETAEKAVTLANIRKAIKNAMLDVSALPECPNRDKILEHLHGADSEMFLSEMILSGY